MSRYREVRKTKETDEIVFDLLTFLSIRNSRTERERKFNRWSIREWVDCLCEGFRRILFCFSSLQFKHDSIWCRNVLLMLIYRHLYRCWTEVSLFSALDCCWQILLMFSHVCFTWRETQVSDNHFSTIYHRTKHRSIVESNWTRRLTRRRNIWFSLGSNISMRLFVTKEFVINSNLEILLSWLTLKL